METCCKKCSHRETCVDVCPVMDTASERNCDLCDEYASCDWYTLNTEPLPLFPQL